MGAFVATALAVETPELVAGLIMIDGGFVPDLPVGVDPEQAIDKLLEQRITQLRQYYPSRESYREFWRSQPHFPSIDWGPWVEAFLDYELGGGAAKFAPQEVEESDPGNPGKGAPQT